MTLTENSPVDLPVECISICEEDTYTLGMRLALQLGKGSIVALKGPLGAGKTCFTKGIAKGLGIAETVTSPTYTIVSEYEGTLTNETVPFYHIDAYRLNGDNDFSSIGGEEIIFGNGVSVIEWYERISGFIPPEAFVVEFEIIEDGKRLIRIFTNENSASVKKSS